MRRAVSFLLALAVVVSSASAVSAQTRRRTPARKAPAKPAPARTVTEPAKISCPQVLGKGVGSHLEFCDVMTGRNPAQGIVISFPPHRGPVTLLFDLHNRHTYSEERVKAGRGYAAYTATIGVLTMESALLARAVVQNEFRNGKDLLDRIAGGAGPGGVKAVAPTGVERIRLEIPAEVEQVSILGEKLTVMTVDGTETFGALERPIAIISNVRVQYTPGRTPTKKR